MSTAMNIRRRRELERRERWANYLTERFYGTGIEVKYAPKALIEFKSDGDLPVGADPDECGHVFRATIEQDHEGSLDVRLLADDRCEGDLLTQFGEQIDDKIRFLKRMKRKMLAMRDVLEKQGKAM